jgi:hypothetical protein
MRSILFLLVAVGVLTGCSSGRHADTSDPEYDLLQEVNELLRAAAGSNQRPPGKLAELNAHQGMFPRGYAAVKSGEVVVQLGMPMQGEGDVGKDEHLVAYEKNAPTAGGYVLLSAGSIKKVSVSEFQSILRAAK